MTPNARFRLASCLLCFKNILKIESDRKISEQRAMATISCQLGLMCVLSSSSLNPGSVRVMLNIMKRVGLACRPEGTVKTSAKIVKVLC